MNGTTTPEASLLYPVRYKMFINKVLNILSSIFSFINGANRVAKERTPAIREFVITTADQLEQWIPDGGMGSVKLAVFDGALKVFVDTLKQEENVSEEESSGVWDLAHFILEGYIAGKKAKETLDAAKSE